MAFHMRTSSLRAFRSPKPIPSAARAVSTTPFQLPAARNERYYDYVRGSPERAKLETTLKALRQKLPLESKPVIAGQTVQTTHSTDQVMPSEHSTVFTRYPLCSPDQVQSAIDDALQAKRSWEETPFVDRAAIFLRAAELVSGKYRHDLIAATMLGQGKNIWQAEIDAGAELADFFRLNCTYAAQILERQPNLGSPDAWTRMEYRPLEGFVYAVSPFNFTAIGGNLVSAPALVGNVVVWKPSPSNVYASYLVYQILLEAGLPPNVIQFVTGDAAQITDTVLQHRDFAALHFTGSSDVFRGLFRQIGENTGNKVYREYPRLVGETSGKNFHLVHASADIHSAVQHTIRGAFEYQGQKCSASSRVYLPQSRADEFLAALKTGVDDISVGGPEQLDCFMGPVIHRGSFDKIKGVLDASNRDPSLTCLAGGSYDDSEGFFVQPTVYVAERKDHPLFDQEIFGPVLVAYVYPDAEYSSLLQSIDTQGGGYALTGSVFASDRRAIREAEDRLRYAAGNFYINCKTTGAIIGQQSFGGGRASGTNDKAGSANLLMRFTSPRTIKEEFGGLDTYLYPSNV